MLIYRNIFDAIGAIVENALKATDCDNREGRAEYVIAAVKQMIAHLNNPEALGASTGDRYFQRVDNVLAVMAVMMGVVGLVAIPPGHQSPEKRRKIYDQVWEDAEKYRELFSQMHDQIKGRAAPAPEGVTIQ